MAFETISKYKRMSSNYNVNRTGSVNNNQKINTSNGANSTSTIQLSMVTVTEDIQCYQIVDVKDEKAEAAKPLLSKGYTQEIIDNYFDYKNGKYTIKSGYEIKTNDEYVDSMRLGSCDWGNGLKAVALMSPSMSSAVSIATGFENFFKFINDGVKVNSSFVVLKNGEPVAACCTIEKNGKTEQYFNKVT
ncbi:hypothetical protein IJ818_05575 [bacterium]|nr:hypothetical protein [bacterium]